MKPERPNKQTPPATSTQVKPEDAGLWDLLGKSSQLTAPDDFLDKVLERKRAAEPSRNTSSPWRALLNAFDTFTEGGWGPGLRLASAFAAIALVCALALWQQQHGNNASAPGAPQVVETDPATTEGSLAAFTIAADDEPDLEYYSMSDDPDAPADVYTDAEVQTILQLDDYLAFEDQQMWLDPSAASFMR